MKSAIALSLLVPALLLLGLGAVAEASGAGGPGYAIVHYSRSDADYGDHTTGDFNDFWGLHLWGDAIDPSEVSEWTAPKPFLAEDDFGRFAWIRRGGSGSEINFILHRGDVKDGTDADRFFDADANPEIWLNGGDATIYTSQADAQGFVTIHYHRDDGMYGSPSADFNTFWGLHLWGDAVDPSEGTEWTAPKVPTASDGYGVLWRVQIVDSSMPVNFIIHRGDLKDPGPDESFIPVEMATVWKQSGDDAMYPSRAAALNQAVIHYHRDAGDYGDPASSDFNDFWGLHAFEGSVVLNSWLDPVRWDRLDVFGPVFEVDMTDAALRLGYILHRGDLKDPGPDQFLVFSDWGHEVWQVQEADAALPYVYPLQVEPDSDGDGIVDACDACPGTVIPELTVPSVRLGNNRYALIDGDDVFDTQEINGRGPMRSYDLAQTGGCSCEQIIAMLALDGGQERFGCSGGTMEDWIAFVAAGPALDGAGRDVDRTEPPSPGRILQGSFPNPFSARTTIRFDLPRAAPVRLAVFDVQGRRIRVLADRTFTAGPHEVAFDAKGLASGWYLARLDTPQGTYARVMQLVK